MLLTTFYVGQIPFVETSQNHRRGMYVTGDNGHHHDNNNCVDVSRYSEVQYNVTRANICTHRKHRACTRKTAPACVSIPVVECAATPVVDCARIAFTAGTFRDDTTVTKRFVPRLCGRRGSRTIVKVHKTPVCRRVTKQQCETKWVKDPATGRKVWAGNENCKEVSREDCALAETSKNFRLPVWSCQAMVPIFYSVPTVREVKVTGYRRECTASVQPVCATRMQQMCTDVEFEECSDTVERICYGCDDDGSNNNTSNPGCLEFRIPYQTHDHRFKCIGTFNS